MDLLERAGELAMSPRFDVELTAAIWQRFPGGVVTDEAEFTTVLNHFALQHELRSGGAVVLRRHKPGYFDGSQLPRTVSLSETLSDAFQRFRP